MKIEEKERNEIRIYVDNIDDLWYLKNVISPGDLVFGTVFRKEERSGDMQRAKKSARKRMRVGIAVKKIEFQDFSDRLRISGKIKAGPEDVVGLYQAINVGVGDEVSVVKTYWSREDREMLDEAVKNAERPQVYFLGLEHGLATFAVLRAYGIQGIASIRKRGDEDEEFFGEVLSTLKSIRSDEYPLVILGPGFYKEDFIKFAGNELKNYSVVQASHGDMRGVHEALKSSLNRLLVESRVSKEEKLVDRLLEEIKKEGLYAYGPGEVEKYLNMGAVATLLISDTKYRKFENMLNLARETGAKIHIISTSHEKGKMLENLGGVAALLRFKE